ncbi:hypothetical protein [Chishuiella sp.]|uniref:hypothetical protein n=1 Tax=Chishuiella sp. TaxID=1969467 RepID=UPI0028A954F5|nr:hypothetical protein [Chishuiella sp.]
MNVKTFFIGLTLILTVSFFSCREDFDYDPLNTDLVYSSDTVSVDTVFNYSKSETYVLKVYNPENENKVIPKIYLSKGSDSYFNINVDGKAGISFENVPIRKKDSLYIFIEVAAEAASANPLYDDEINFETTSSTKQIKLLSWIEKANVREKDATISSENWDSNEAQVIDGNLTVTSDLTIDKGTTVYFKKGASLTIADNAKLTVNGALNNEVKFRYARQSNKYDSIPNQWKKIELSPNSSSVINYAKIIGGDTGLAVNNASLEISNSKIVNNQSYGILANNAIIKGYNLILNNSNLASLAIESGGNYEFYHSTFANYFNFNGSAGPAYAVYLSNTDSENSANPLTKAIFGNCIIYNERTPNALVFNKNDGASFNYLFDSNIIHNTDTTVLNVLTDSNFLANITKDPEFVNTNYTANKLSVKETSPAKNAGKAEYTTLFPIDYNGINRQNSPTIGALQ